MNGGGYKFPYSGLETLPGQNLPNSPGEHVTRLLHLVARNVMLHVWFVDPSLDVDDLLPVVVRHGRAVDLV